MPQLNPLEAPTGFVAVEQPDGEGCLGCHFKLTTNSAGVCERLRCCADERADETNVVFHLAEGTEESRRPGAGAESEQHMNAEFIQVMSEVLRISDRKHDAWDRAKELLAEASNLTCKSVQASAQGPDNFPLSARVWKRESTQEWVLEISGTINDTYLACRHTDPLSTPPQDVPGLPSSYLDRSEITDNAQRFKCETAKRLLDELNQAGAFNSEEFGFAQEMILQYGGTYIDDDAEIVGISAKDLFVVMKVLGYGRRTPQLVGLKAAPATAAPPANPAQAIGEAVDMPEFDALDDEVIDNACTAGSIYRVDLMRAWESIRAQVGTTPPASLGHGLTQDRIDAAVKHVLELEAQGLGLATSEYTAWGYAIVNAAVKAHKESTNG